MLRPRLNLRHGVWACFSFHWPVRLVGCGRTPLQAYADWHAQLSLIAEDR